MSRKHTTVLERMKKHVLQWLQDPFGRKRIDETHSRVLTEIRELKAAVQTTTNQYNLNDPSTIQESRHARRLRRIKNTSPVERIVLGNQKEGYKSWVD